MSYFVYFRVNAMTRTKRPPARYNDDDYDTAPKRSKRKRQESDTDTDHEEQERSRPNTKRSKRSKSKTKALQDDMADMRSTLNKLEGFMETIMNQTSGHSQSSTEASQQPRPGTSTSPRGVTPEPEIDLTESNLTDQNNTTGSSAGPFIETTGNNDDPILHQFLPMPRPVITAGVDIAAHVPANLKAKIWRDEYVDMSQLLPTNPYHQPQYTFTLDPHSRSNFAIRLQKPKASNLSFDQWEDAFLVYKSVYNEKHNKCKEMCTYMKDIKSLAARNANFRHYDEQFRLFRQSTHCSWATVHPGLWFQATNPPARHFTKTHQGNERPSNSKSPFHVPRGYCVSYHSRNKYCKTPNQCHYKHVCPKCSERHPMYSCDSNRKPNTEVSATQQQHTAKKPTNTNQTK